jgi:hypothetical protein
MGLIASVNSSFSALEKIFELNCSFSFDCVAYEKPS